MGDDAAARAADDSERNQPASVCNAEGHHGGQEEGDSKGRAAPCGPAAEDCQAVRAREGQEDRDHLGLAGRSREGARAEAPRRGEGDLTRPAILVVAEQRGGKLNRATWETIAAAQQLAAFGSISVIVPGVGVKGVASELAAADVEEVVAVEHTA